MKSTSLVAIASLFLSLACMAEDVPAEGARRFPQATFSSDVDFADVRMRNACVLPDPATGTYTIVASAGNGVRAYTSKDLITWEGPHMIFRTPEDLWPGVEMRTKLNWPLEWTVAYGKGRVYTSTFGHVWKGDTQPERMRCAGLQTVVVRALRWLAHREVTFPVPADFPTAETISVRGAIPLPVTP